MTECTHIDFGEESPINIEFITGEAGTDGATWHDGTGIPSDSLGNNGDYYLDTDSGSFYQKSVGIWGSPIYVMVGGSTIWGGITGTLTNQLDLVAYIETQIGEISIPTTLSELSEDATHRLVTDTEKSTWNSKEDTLLGLLNHLKQFDLDTNKIGTNKAIYVNSSGEIVSSAVTSDELTCLDGCTSYIQTQIDNKLNTSLKGSNNGLAELDSGGFVPSSQLPSYVDDVLEYSDFTSLPATGETGKIYITQDDNKTYRWSGSQYTEISSSLALGETSGTAYRGDRGKTAYDHVTGDGKSHSDVILNNTHRSSNGSNHSFIDQSVVIGSSPAFLGANITGVLASAVTTVTTLFDTILTSADNTVQKSLQTINDFFKDLYTDIKDSTGFADAEDVIINYDATTRKITLTGTVKARFRGKIIPELVSGWVSEAHADVAGVYFLCYCSTGFVWSTSPWLFDSCQIAYVNYTYGFGLREAHGFMGHDTHKVLHDKIGTYRDSGGGLTNYTLNTTTDADRRPDIALTVIMDEDLKTSISALVGSSGTYTRINLDGAIALPVFAKAEDDLAYVTAGDLYWNENDSGTWKQTVVDSNNFMSMWLVALPVTADVGSQAFRYVWVQGQSQSNLASTQKALSSLDLDLASLESIAAESVFIQQIILKNTPTDWEIEEVIELTGSRSSQVRSSAGNYLSTVAVDDTTIEGNGTVTDPLNVVADGINDTHIDWGTGTNQVNADDIPDGSTNAIITKTQETNFETAYSNMVETLTAGENLVAGNICYLKASDGKYWKAKADADTTSGTQLRVALATISADATGSFLSFGKYTTTGLTKGDVFISDATAGLATVTAPTTSTNIVRKIGANQSATTFFFNPDSLYLELD